MAEGYLVPTVLEQSERGERAFDLYSRLLKDRIVILGTQIDDTVATLVSAQLLHLAAEDPDKDISLYVNSPGGSVTATFAIYDTMQFISPDVSTVCMGMAASGAAVVLAAGAPGKRFALPNARVLIHQPHGGAQGQQIDIEIQAARDGVAASPHGGAAGRAHRPAPRAGGQGLRPRLHHGRRGGHGLRHGRPGHHQAPPRCAPTPRWQLGYRTLDRELDAMKSGAGG